VTEARQELALPIIQQFGIGLAHPHRDLVAGADVEGFRATRWCVGERLPARPRSATQVAPAAMTTAGKSRLPLLRMRPIACTALTTSPSRLDFRRPADAITRRRSASVRRGQAGQGLLIAIPPHQGGDQLSTTAGNPAEGGEPLHLNRRMLSARTLLISKFVEVGLWRSDPFAS
jgi:hypothetical protein